MKKFLKQCENRILGSPAQGSHQDNSDSAPTILAIQTQQSATIQNDDSQ